MLTSPLMTLCPSAKLACSSDTRTHHRGSTAPLFLPSFARWRACGITHHRSLIPRWILTWVQLYSHKWLTDLERCLPCNGMKRDGTCDCLVAAIVPPSSCSLPNGPLMCVCCDHWWQESVLRRRILPIKEVWTWKSSVSKLSALTHHIWIVVIISAQPIGTLQVWHSELQTRLMTCELLTTSAEVLIRFATGTWRVCRIHYSVPLSFLLTTSRFLYALGMLVAERVVFEACIDFHHIDFTRRYGSSGARGEKPLLVEVFAAGSVVFVYKH